MINQCSVSAPTTAKRQSGVVLAISLVILLALTLIAVTSSKVTGLEEKMTANSKELNLAFQAAEAALRAAEASLSTKPSAFNGNPAVEALKAAQGTGGYYTLLNGDEVVSDTGNQKAPPTLIDPQPDDPFYESVVWTSNKVITYSNASASGNKLVGLSRAPVYIIEMVSNVGSESTTEGSLEGGTIETESPGRVMMFRITAHGWGSNADAVATVQSIVKVQY